MANLSSVEETSIKAMPETRASKRAAVSPISTPKKGETQKRRKGLRSAGQEEVSATTDTESADTSGSDGNQSDGKTSEFEPEGTSTEGSSVAKLDASRSEDEAPSVSGNDLSVSSDDEGAPVSKSRRAPIRRTRYTVLDSSQSGSEGESESVPPLKLRLRRRKPKVAVSLDSDIDGETSSPESEVETAASVLAQMVSGTESDSSEGSRAQPRSNLTIKGRKSRKPSTQGTLDLNPGMSYRPSASSGEVSSGEEIDESDF